MAPEYSRTRASGLGGAAVQRGDSRVRSRNPEKDTVGSEPGGAARGDTEGSRGRGKVAGRHWPALRVVQHFEHHRAQRRPPGPRPPQLHFPLLLLAASRRRRRRSGLCLLALLALLGLGLPPPHHRPRHGRRGGARRRQKLHSRIHQRLHRGVGRGARARAGTYGHAMCSAYAHTHAGRGNTPATAKRIPTGTPPSDAGGSSGESGVGKPTGACVRGGTSARMPESGARPADRPARRGCAATPPAPPARPRPLSRLRP